jgi:hypothetical protein
METDAARSRLGSRKTLRRASAISRPLELLLLGWIDTADAFQFERYLYQRFGAIPCALAA